MSFWVFISQWAESSNKSLIVHNPGEDSGVLGSTEVSLNNYYFKHFFLMLDFLDLLIYYFFKQCSPWYLMTLEWNLSPMNEKKWKFPTVSEPQKTPGSDHRETFSEEGKRFVLDVCKLHSARRSEDVVLSAPKSWETLCFSEDGKMPM